MGNRPKPTAIRRLEGNRGKRAWNHDEPRRPMRSRAARRTCPRGRRRVAAAGALAARHGGPDHGSTGPRSRPMPAYARWVEAEEKLKETPALLKTPSGYVQQSPWVASPTSSSS